MNRRVDIRGKSGQTYAFTRLEDENFLRQVGVTFVIATPTLSGWRVLEVGETNNLADGSWQARLAAARVGHAQAELLIRLNVSRSVRDAEVSDIEANAATT